MQTNRTDNNNAAASPPGIGNKPARACVWRCLAAVLLVLYLPLFLASGLRSGYLNITSPEKDYFVFFMAGDMVNRGQLDQLYDPAAQTAYRLGYEPAADPQVRSSFLNPPHYAWCMSLLARLGYGPSLVVWWGLSLVCFVATALLWRGWLGAKDAWLAVLLAVCMPAWFQTLVIGQNSFLSLLILTVFCGLLMTGREGWAGLVLCLLVYKYQLLIVPAMLLVMKRRWRAVGGLVTGGILTVAFTAVVMGPQVLIDYIGLVPGFGKLMQAEGFRVYRQHSWYGFFQLLGAGWMPGVSVGILAATASITSLALLIPVWRGPWAARSSGFALQLCALTVAAVLASAHLFHYDMLIITLPAVLWLRAAKDGQIAAATWSVKPMLAVGFVWLVLAGPIANAWHLQLSPILMLVWLVILARAFAGIRAVAAAANEPNVVAAGSAR